VTARRERAIVVRFAGKVFRRKRRFFTRCHRFTHFVDAARDKVERGATNHRAVGGIRFGVGLARVDFRLDPIGVRDITTARIATESIRTALGDERVEFTIVVCFARENGFSLCRRLFGWWVLFVIVGLFWTRRTEQDDN
jgi:hypothetical protein